MLVVTAHSCLNLSKTGPEQKASRKARRFASQRNTFYASFVYEHCRSQHAIITIIIIFLLCFRLSLSRHPSAKSNLPPRSKGSLLFNIMESDFFFFSFPPPPSPPHKTPMLCCSSAAATSAAAFPFLLPTAAFFLPLRARGSTTSNSPRSCPVTQAPNRLNCHSTVVVVAAVSSVPEPWVN